MGDRGAFLVGGAAGAGVFVISGHNVLAFIMLALAVALAGYTPKPGLDPVRLFSTEDRRTIFENAHGRCQNARCGRPVHYETDCPHGGCDDDYQADHKYPWSKGGRTILSNGACLCRKCNLAKSNH